MAYYNHLRAQDLAFKKSKTGKIILYRALKNFGPTIIVC